MIEEKEFQLTGNVSYSVKMRYKWLTEPGACKVCKSMHGKLYDKDKVPKKPHPNCKCHVEEVSVIDPQISRANNYKEELEQLMLQAQKLKGDTSYLKAQTAKNMKEAQSNDLKREADTVQQKIEELCNELKGFFDWYNQQEKTLSKQIIIQKQKKLDDMKNTSNKLNKMAKDWFIKNLKEAQDVAVDKLEKFGPDAAALWKIGSSKFTQGLDYIKKNGNIVNDINDLYDKKLINAVKAKVESQFHKSNSRGIVFHENSSLAKSIANSKEFNKFVEDNIYELCVEDKVLDTHIEFKSDINNFCAIKFAQMIDVYVENGILHAKVIDTLDYNPNQWWVIVPRILQEYGMIEGYYHVTKISVPISKWLQIK